MNYLHFENVIHRDLNSSNILLSLSKEAKVSDFGLSRKKEPGISVSCTMGAVAWMAPEVIENAKSFTKKSDVYSYGIILWEILTRGDPCPTEMNSIMLASEVVNNAFRPQLPHPNISPPWEELIKRCWAQNPDDRPSFEEILISLESFESPVNNASDPEHLSSVSSRSSPLFRFNLT